MTGQPPRWVRWSRPLLIGGGLLIAGYAVTGAYRDPFVHAELGGYLFFLAAVLIGHELVLLPVAIGVGALIGRLVPAAARTVVRVAAFTSAAVLAVGVPLALGYGRRPDDPSALPLDYRRGLVLTLAATWLIALTTLIVRRATRTDPTTAAPPETG